MYTTWWVFTKWTPTSICYIYNILYLKDIGEDHLTFPMTLIYLGYLWKYPSFVYTIIMSWVTNPFGRSFPCKRLLAWSKGRQLDNIAQLTSGWETTTTHLIQSDVHVGLCFCSKTDPTVTLHFIQVTLFMHDKERKRRVYMLRMKTFQGFNFLATFHNNLFPNSIPAVESSGCNWLFFF